VLLPISEQISTLASDLVTSSVPSAAIMTSVIVVSRWRAADGSSLSVAFGMADFLLRLTFLIVGLTPLKKMASMLNRNGFLLSYRAPVMILLNSS
jgi:hypothetical protein